MRATLAYSLLFWLVVASTKHKVLVITVITDYSSNYTSFKDDNSTSKQIVKKKLEILEMTVLGMPGACYVARYKLPIINRIKWR